ncbi:MAG TPA: SDR family oxidoreductase, partial [Longimicrobiaceae bacterium]|nr:SDR family oxidoreductase [Longimicrobiaceae bacterium]
HAIPRMVEQEGGGTLLFVSSRSAREGRAGHVGYAVSKAGLLTLAEGIAEEYGAEGIRANAILPGTMDTEGNRQAMPDADRSGWVSPEEVARVLLFLASPAAAAVNGAAIPVYGRG